MKKISLLFVMLLAFTVSTTAQSLPKPGMPKLTEFIDYGFMIDLGYKLAADFDGNLVTDDFTLAQYFSGASYTILDPEKVYFSIYTDNDQIFTFTPEMFPGEITDPMTQVPYSLRSPGGSIGYWDMHFDDFTTIGDDPNFTWRIGIQTIYIDGEETSYSDISYMEVYPQLQEAKEVTPTSFVADWSCDDPNTFTINNFIEDNTPDVGYNLYVVNVETQETIVVNKVNPTNWTKDEWGYDVPLAGATYTVEGLTPGATYQFYVVTKQNTGVTFQSVVREVTLPETVYILGEVNEQGWAPNVGTPMEYDAEKNVYTATVTCDGRGENGENYFSFTTRLADNSDNWNEIAPYRFGAVSEGNFWVTDEMLGVELSMELGGDAYRIPAGEYKLTVDYANMILVIEKIVPPHGYDLGDVNHDRAVNIADVTALIDYLLENGTVCEICADVNGDTVVNIADVTALIDVLLGND